MSNCEKFLDMISAYIDGELSDAEKAELEAHIETCEDCRSVLEIYRGISLELSGDMEEVPDGFSAGVMDKVDGYEKIITAKSRRKVWSIAGKWIGAAACIAVILFAFPQMPGLGCGASKDAAMENTAAGSCEGADTGTAAGGDWDGSAYDIYEDTTGSVPEDSVETDMSFSDAAVDEDDPAAGSDVKTEGCFGGTSGSGDTESDNADNGSFDIGMVVTVYSGEIHEMLLPLDGTLNENGDIEYYVPISAAREIAASSENAKVEVLDTDIEGMMALVIIKK